MKATVLSLLAIGFVAMATQSCTTTTYDSKGRVVSQTGVDPRAAAAVALGVSQVIGTGLNYGYAPYYGGYYLSYYAYPW
jgi:cytosine/uracil/thiamine/allantoin permease